MALKSELPSPELLRELLSYDPKTGKLTWLPREERHCSSVRAMKIFNARWGGREAFTALHAYGYRVGCVNQVDLLAHRVIWAIVHGEWPAAEVDHIDHDSGNNRLENLRAADHQMNGRNMRRRRDNSSGHTGVFWWADRGKWMAYIRGNDGRFKNLGYFEDFEAACAARRAAEARLGYHSNHGKVLAAAA